MLAIMFILIKISIIVLGSGFVLYAIWTFVGYKCRWKHIFCSYQNAYHLKMTPNDIDWGWIRKSDAYGVPIIFLVLGVACLALIFLPSGV